MLISIKSRVKNPAIRGIQDQLDANTFENKPIRTRVTIAWPLESEKFSSNLGCVNVVIKYCSWDKRIQTPRYSHSSRWVFQCISSKSISVSLCVSIQLSLHAHLSLTSRKVMTGFFSTWKVTELGVRRSVFEFEQIFHVVFWRFRWKWRIRTERTTKISLRCLYRWEKLFVLCSAPQALPSFCMPLKISSQKIDLFFV